MLKNILKRVKFRKNLRKKKEYEKEFYTIESKLKLINKKLKKKEISFLHSGHLGDIINSLPAIKEIAKNRKCNLYIDSKKYLNLGTHSSGKFFLNENSINKLLPLLNSIDYINKVQLYKKEKIDIDLNLFRELPINFNMDSVRWYFHLTGIHNQLSLPYINVEKVKIFENSIVIMRSLIRQNKFINYKFINKYENILFVGLPDEYKDLKKSIKNMKYHECKNFLELARIIKSCKIFIGNLSFGFALAEAVKCPRLLETHLDFPLIYPNGKDSYDFFFQEHFESLFKKIYNKKLAS